MTRLTKLFEPGKIGTLEIKNRIVMAPMYLQAHDPEGFIRDHLVDYFVERAKGGVGLIITMSSSSLAFGRAPGRAGTWDDKFIPGLRKVSRAVHEAGAKIAWQILYHGKLLSVWLDQPPPEFAHTSIRKEEIRAIGPSAIPWVYNNKLPEEATKQDIEEIVEGFGEAARRVKDAGFDAVEVHGAHGYAITQWLSPRDNKRTDEYGGSVENRARFACDIIRRVRQKVGPDFPILFRFSGSDFLPGGINIEDSVRQAPLFVEAGADALHVSACEFMTTQWQFLSYLFPDAAIVHLAEAIKKVVKVPVITVGKIWDPRFAERILQEGKADFVAMGRALIADPELPNKAREGRFEDIRRCIYCNNCLQVGIRPPSVKARGRTCTINPAMLREREFEIKPTSSPKKVIAVGGGLAGMEAARTLAERGHHVTLYEKSHKLGGQWAIASKQPSKEAFASVTDRLSSGLEKAGVTVKLNFEVTPQVIDEAKPDAVVVATGATPATLDVPGIEGKNVVQAVDVIMGKAEVGDRVVVVGGRYVGMEVADYLAEQGKKVTLVTRRSLGRDTEENIYRELRNRLVDKGVNIYQFTPVDELREDGVHIVFNQELLFLKADTVVLAVGAKSENSLAQELQKAGVKVYTIGDCVKPRDAAEAIREGAEVGREI